MGRAGVLLPVLATLRRGALAGCTLSVGARSGLDSTALKTLWSDMGYDRMARPADATTGTVDAGSDGVDLQVHLLSYDLDESLQVWTPRYFFRQQWRDARLAYNVSENCDGDRAHVFLHDYEWRVAIWRPMPYTKNVASLEDGIFLSGGTWIFPDGTVFESRMINEVLSCPMDVRRMPFDTQKCEILKGNYVYDDSQVHLGLLDADLPVEIDRFFFSHNTWHIEERVGKLKVLDYLEFSPVYTEVSFMLDPPLPPPEL